MNTNPVGFPTNSASIQTVQNGRASRKRERSDETESQEDIINDLYDQIMKEALDRLGHGWSNPVDDSMTRKFTTMKRMAPEHPKVKDLEQQMGALLQDLKAKGYDN